MRVLLVDDNDLFLEGLYNLLQANEIEVAGIANNGQEALIKVASLQPEVILMDIQMPGMDGIETTRLIKGKYPKVKIVILTVSEDDQCLFEAIKAGASGYLLKGLNRDNFLELLTGLATGESPLSPGLAGKILREFARRERESEMVEVVPCEVSSKLTQREVEILKLVAQGLTYKMTAARFGITESQVKYHMGEITTKLHLNSRAQAVAYAVEMGLVSPKGDNSR